MTAPSQNPYKYQIENLICRGISLNCPLAEALTAPQGKGKPFDGDVKEAHQ